MELVSGAPFPIQKRIICRKNGAICTIICYHEVFEELFNIKLAIVKKHESNSQKLIKLTEFL